MMNVLVVYFRCPWQSFVVWITFISMINDDFRKNWLLVIGFVLTVQRGGLAVCIVVAFNYVLNHGLSLMMIEMSN